jgi:hypothetical protein
MLFYFVITYTYFTDTETVTFTTFPATWKSIEPLVNDILGYHGSAPVML